MRVYERECLARNSISFVDIYLPIYGRCFAAGCPSHVCPDLRLPLYGHLPRVVLIEVSSIAIWNRNKVAVVIAISVWGINVVFLVEGGCLPFPLYEVFTRCFVTGAARVSHEFQLFGPSHLMSSVAAL